MEGLSPFALLDLDLDLDEVERLNDEDGILNTASLVSVKEIRTLRKKMKICVPTEAENSC